tara:strand:+ start:610 stop:1062 length:453 start_codon:yes stop_codon:yes gene_type:complete
MNKSILAADAVSEANSLIDLIIGPGGAIVLLVVIGWALWRATWALSRWIGGKIEVSAAWGSTKLESWIEDFLDQIKAITNQNTHLIDNYQKDREMYLLESEKDRKAHAKIISLERDSYRSFMGTLLAEFQLKAATQDKKIDRILNKITTK